MTWASYLDRLAQIRVLNNLAANLEARASQPCGRGRGEGRDTSSALRAVGRDPGKPEPPGQLLPVLGSLVHISFCYMQRQGNAWETWV